jgi:hypothetical protein
MMFSPDFSATSVVLRGLRIRFPGLLLFRRVLPPLAPIVLPTDRTDDDKTHRIRCPRCDWTPDSSSRWSCLDSRGYPEFFDGGCGTSWNTFHTRGRCPGCSHQWKWTICLSCASWSMHRDWYE